MGSAITYFRRYSLSSALGIITDADTDASGQYVAPKKKESVVNNPRYTKAIQALAMDKAKIEQILDVFDVDRDTVQGDLELFKDGV